VSDETRAKRVIEQRKADRNKMMDGMRDEQRHQTPDKREGAAHGGGAASQTLNAMSRGVGSMTSGMKSMMGGGKHDDDKDAAGPPSHRSVSPSSDSDAQSADGDKPTGNSPPPFPDGGRKSMARSDRSRDIIWVTRVTGPYTSHPTPFILHPFTINLRDTPYTRTPKP